MTDTRILSQEAYRRCQILGDCSEEPGRITRTFLSPPMRDVHRHVAGWMQAAGMQTRLDAIGTLIGHYPGTRPDAPRFLLGSHLDTVPDAGKYDGILGVMLGIAVVEALAGERLPCALEVLAFSEEEGIRFRASCLGSKAVAGCFDPALLALTDAAGVSLADAIRAYGLDPDQLPRAAYAPGTVRGYLEAHIEQGPVLESQNLALGAVEAIVGISRFWLQFDGKAGHAGTLPMEMRQDALTAAAEFVLAAETRARTIPGLRATVGTLGVRPGGVNVVPAQVQLSLDLRHPVDAVRAAEGQKLLDLAAVQAAARGVHFQVERATHTPAVPTDPTLTDRLVAAATAVGHPPLRMASGAGHDAGYMARLCPVTMLFLRSPGGISHNPAESVHVHDIDAALQTMLAFVRDVTR